MLFVFFLMLATQDRPSGQMVPWPWRCTSASIYGCCASSGRQHPRGVFEALKWWEGVVSGWGWKRIEARTPSCQVGWHKKRCSRRQQATPYRRSRGTLRAPCPPLAAHHHCRWSARQESSSHLGVVARLAADTSHAHKLPVCPGTIGRQYPSCRRAFWPAKTCYACQSSKVCSAVQQRCLIGRTGEKKTPALLKTPYSIQQHYVKYQHSRRTHTWLA